MQPLRTQLGSFATLLGIGVFAVSSLFAAPRAAANEPVKNPGKKTELITYSKQVSRIIQDRCQTCHHPGTAAPFSLLTYDDASNWSETIREVIADKRMPPWHADPRYGKFSNDRRLPAEEAETLLAWLDNGMEKGSEKDLPP